MRILFIHNTYRQRGGEDVALELETTLLAERGHDVRITLFSNDEDISGFTGKMRLGWNAIYNRTSAKTVRQVIREFAPDLIHVHNWFFQASPSILYAAAKEQVPVIMTIHNYRLVCANALLLRNNKPCELCINEKFPLYGIKYKCYRQSSGQSALVTAITGIHKSMNTWQNKVDNYIILTPFAKSRLEGSSFKVDPSKLIIKPNFIPDPGEGLPDREGYYLFAGRLSIEKGVHTLCEAFAGLPGSRLILVGEGSEYAVLEQRFASATNITFAGKRSRPELLGMMKKCKALVFPSIWYEGLPFTILEAFATGTPVIASDLGSMSGMITNEYNGLLFEPGNAASLKAAIAKFEMAGQALKPLYANARQTYLDLYHPDIHYRSIMDIYERSLANRKKSNA
ncbi:MAG TPA: glycosyltransferase family 4 protein [Chitinophagaceae bacterium]